jgi:hypothetical protein
VPVNHEDTKMNFDDMEKAAWGMGERRDCAVKAVAAVTDTHYVDVHGLMARFGRKARQPTLTVISRRVLAALGFHTKDVTDCYKSKTIRTLGREMKYQAGTYLVWTSSGHHILAIVDGQVCDWTEGRCHRIHKIERVFRKSAA